MDNIPYIENFRQNIKKNEDCLYLNVFEPETASDNKMAVLLYIGGTHTQGSGMIFDGGYLASSGNIVVVTMNYRLGALGFLGGNYGIKDQIKAMEWVRDNIGSFNGNPAKVTILGDDQSGMDVGLHLLSPLSKDLFVRAISQSGPPTSGMAWRQPGADPLLEARSMAEALGCEDTATEQKIKAFLREKSTDDLMKGHKTYKLLSTPEFRTLVDGEFLTKDPVSRMEEMTEEDFTGKQYALGVTLSELDMWAMGMQNFANTSKNLREFFQITPANAEMTTGVLRGEYDDTGRKEVASCSAAMSDAVFVAPTVQTADLLSDKMDVYVYQWARATVPPPNWYAPWFQVPHAEDLYYLFGAPLVGGNIAYNFTDVDREMSKFMMDAWSNFVKTGVLGPSSGTPPSVKYDSAAKSYERFDVNVNNEPQMTVKNDLAPDATEFWLGPSDEQDGGDGGN